MWHHARLLRRVLLISSVLTLSGLHVPSDRSPPGWRAVRLVPVSLGLVASVANMAATFTASDAYTIVSSVMFNMSTLLPVLTLVYLQRRRARLHGLLRRLAALEETTALCHRPGDHTQCQRCAGVLAALSAAAGLLWTAAFFAGGQFRHPHYLSPVLVPAALRGPAWYWALIGLQAATTIICLTSQAVSDLIQIGLTDAVAVLLDRLGRYGQEYVVGDRQTAPGDRVRGPPAEAWRQDGRELSWRLGDPGQEIADGTGTALVSNHSQAVDNGQGRCISIAVPMSISSVESGPGPADAATSARYPDLSRRAQSGPTVTGRSAVAVATAVSVDCSLTDPGGDLESAILQLSETYRSISALAGDAAVLCSPLTLTQHSNITVQLLVGLYITIGMFTDNITDTVLKASYVLFLLVTVLRLAAVSVTGSRLATSSGRLADTLADAALPLGRRLPPHLQFTLHLLIEQTRRPPEFAGCGFFVTQKATMLSLLSFVLTYFIIMVQMNV